MTLDTVKPANCHVNLASVIYPDTLCTHIFTAHLAEQFEIIIIIVKSVNEIPIYYNLKEKKKLLHS